MILYLFLIYEHKHDAIISFYDVAEFEHYTMQLFVK